MRLGGGKDAAPARTGGINRQRTKAGDTNPAYRLALLFLAIEEGNCARQSLRWRCRWKGSPGEDGVFAFKDSAAPRSSARINSTKLAHASALLNVPSLRAPPLARIVRLARARCLDRN